MPIVMVITSQAYLFMYDIAIRQRFQLYLFAHRIFYVFENRQLAII